MIKRFQIYFLPTIALLFFGQQAQAQKTIWSFGSSIATEKYTELNGVIDGKYPITMHWERAYAYCGENPNRFSPIVLYGWYEYKKIGKRIPLIGQMSSGDSNEEFLTLYVATDPVNNEFHNSCKIDDFREVFRVEACCEVQNMTWQLKGKAPVPVELEFTHEYQFVSQAILHFKIGGVEINKFDISAITELDYIDYVDVLGEKEIGGIYHAIIGFGHNSRPGSRGMGMCGAGVEGYIGYLKLSKDFELAEFRFLQDESCFKDLEDTYVAYDKENPEEGIRLAKY
ncbi:MAG: hypothetical protein AAFQ94_22090 [Bacteroidota bacterium]